MSIRVDLPALLCAGLIATATMAAIVPLGAQSAQYRGPARVIDGDTIEIGSTRIRFHGIDAPESRQTCRDANGAVYACGQRSTQYLRKLIAGRIVTCTDLGPAINGRRRARCFAGSTDLQAAMASAGHAIAFRAHGDDYTGQAAAAQAAKRGVWQGSYATPRAVRKCRNAGKKSLLGTGRTAAECS